MCGRYVFTSPLESIQKMFRFEERLNLAANYNVAPTHIMPIIRRKEGGQGRELAQARWGLIPFWAKDAKIGYKTINARAETVQSTPAFRDAFKKRRALVPANGFIEWKRDGDEKQSFLIRLLDGELFAFAGLWSTWQNPEGETITSYTIITTRPNELCAEIHDRMPVILKQDDHDRWLDPDRGGDELLTPFPADLMEAYPIDKRVGNVRNNEASLIERI